ncbi:MAG: membrane protein insertase YidC [Streptosporangiaceae bacterium]
MSALDPLNGVVAWVIIRLHTALGHLFGPNTGLAWGLSIVILVVAIRILLVPLFVKQVHAQRKMAQHAPYLQELRKKYKGDKQRLNEETMKFYKENGVNPLAGCLPMIPQMIVFFALFSVLRAIAGWNGKTALPYGLTVPVVKSAQKATIFGVHLGDKLLFSHQHVPLHVAIVIALSVLVSAGTTFMTVRQTSKRGLMQTNVDPDNPMAQSQKYMMYVVPFFSLTGLYWQYGLVLYWVTTNMWTLGQQFFMFRNWTVEPAGAAGATAPAAPGTGARTGTAKTTSGTPRASSASRTSSAGRTSSSSSSSSSSAARTSAAAKTPGTARTSSAAKTSAAGSRTGSTASTGSTRSTRSTGAAGSRPGTAANGSTGGTNGSSVTRTGSARGDASANTAAVPADQSNGGARRGLLRLGRQKQEPAPEPEVPTAKVVRQQPVRQARSKRSGNKR